MSSACKRYPKIWIKTDVSQPDLQDATIEDPEIDGSSLVQDGKQSTGNAVVMATKIIETAPLPTDTSAQRPGPIALQRALELSAGKRVNIWTDSKYDFTIVHAHGAICKERGLLTAQRSQINYKQVILSRLDAIQLPREVAVLHCKVYQPEVSGIHVENRLADKAVRDVAQQGILALIPGKLFHSQKLALDIVKQI
ncbi:hypothetical protein DUI87_03093 [Hirundo rustica rustica]|uniref:RNase H type-1 domain-containing protein n=1 Tax=Hirundo rustica rustica TaxID=333673 RepID=A0A3M0L381_HIRRU|nr:hypothetical protein DUI87_03093 [Hirundo rustica rustica]